MPLITTGDRQLVILPTDPAIPEDGTADEWDEYRRTWNEEVLRLTAEPKRHEIRGLSLRERLWAKGEIEMAKRHGAGYLILLSYCRVGLAGHDDRRVPFLGMQLLPDEVVWDVLGSVDAVTHLGFMIYSENEIGDDLGKGSASQPNEPTETPKSED